MEALGQVSVIAKESHDDERSHADDLRAELRDEARLKGGWCYDHVPRSCHGMTEAKELSVDNGAKPQVISGQTDHD